MHKTDMSDKVLSYIRDYRKNRGVSPSYYEIGKALGLRSSSTVAYHIRRLMDDGKLMRKVYWSQRSLVPVEELEDAGRFNDHIQSDG